VYCDSCSEDEGGVIIVFISAVFGVGVVFVLLVGLVVLVDDVGGGGRPATYVVGSAAMFAAMQYHLA
jgi:hypothetical protein